MRRIKSDFMSDEGNFLAAGIAWTTSLAWFTFLGFVMGQIIGNDHTNDLRVSDMTRSITGGEIGFTVGVIVAVIVTVVYPRYTKKDADEEAHGIDHHH